MGLFKMCSYIGMINTEGKSLIMKSGPELTYLHGLKKMI